MNDLPSPHGDKLRSLIRNKKLPSDDLERVQQVFKRYEQWRQELRSVRGGRAQIVQEMVSLLNAYKRYVEVDLIFDSPHDFLYRQRGQLKIENTILEEFLPLLVAVAFQELVENDELVFGPTTCFSGLRFESSITNAQPGGGMRVREKDHDFAISRRLFIQASHHADFQDTVTAATHLAYIAAECKTNLDKTMFQEAAATALDVKAAVPGAQYYLLCEWLDMTPINTSTTAIDEILILRKARRLPANLRAQFNTYDGRQRNRKRFVEYLESHPFSAETFVRFLEHVHQAITQDEEDQVLARGYF